MPQKYQPEILAAIRADSQDHLRQPQREGRNRFGPHTYRDADIQTSTAAASRLFTDCGSLPSAAPTSTQPSYFPKINKHRGLNCCVMIACHHHDMFSLRERPDRTG